MAREPGVWSLRGYADNKGKRYPQGASLLIDRFTTAFSLIIPL